MVDNLSRPRRGTGAGVGGSTERTRPARRGDRELNLIGVGAGQPGGVGAGQAGGVGAGRAGAGMGPCSASKLILT
jgi:hypothetical protein